MKYKAYITESSIFWTKNSVDKPTKDNFDLIMRTAEWVDLGNVTPNFINQFNGSIVVDKDTYTYLKLHNTETGEVKYYSVDRVNKVLNNGFIIDITLDVFTTYTINIYNRKMDTWPVKVNRSTAYCLASDYYSKLQKDDLITLPNIPKLHQNNNKVMALSFGCKEYSWHTNSLVSGYRYKMSSDSEWVLKTRYTETFEILSFDRFGSGKLYTQMLFDVYQDVDGAWFIVPIFGERHTQFNTDDWWAEFSVNIGSNLNYKCFNYLQFVEKIKNNTFWVNKYKGRFHLPNWMNIIANTGIPVVINTNADDNNRSYSVLMIKIRNGINNFRYQYGPNKMYFDFTTRTTNNFNMLESRKINTYALSKMSQSELPTFYFNDIVDLDKIWLTGNNSTLFFDSVNQNYINYNFNPTSGISMFTFGFNGLVKIDGTETFPTSTNEYKSYLASVQSTQNTQIQLAKQNAIVGGVKSFINGAMGAASAALSGNVMGAVSSTVGAFSGIADSVMQYQNKKREMDAQNADKQRSATANNIEPSSVESVIKNSTITLKDVPGTSRLNIGELDGVITSTSYNNLLDKMNCSLINKIVWECGYVVNKVITMDALKKVYDISYFSDAVNDFIYWDIEVPIEYIKVNYPNYNNELIDAISTTFNNPIRFWNSLYPWYDTQLKIAYKRKSSRYKN